MAQFGSVLGSGPRGRGFESRHSDHQKSVLLMQDGFFLRRKAAAYGFLCGLRLCERVISKTKRRGFASSPEKNKKHPGGVLFYGITPRKT